MELLPRQVYVLVTGQTVQSAGLDRVNNFYRGAFCRYKIKPTTRREFRVIQPKNVFGNRIAAAKAVKEPSIDLVLLQCPLNGFNVCFVHAEIIWVRMFGR